MHRTGIKLTLILVHFQSLRDILKRPPMMMLLLGQQRITRTGSSLPAGRSARRCHADNVLGLPVTGHGRGQEQWIGRWRIRIAADQCVDHFEFDVGWCGATRSVAPRKSVNETGAGGEDVAKGQEELVENRAQNIEEQHNGIGDDVEILFVYGRGGGRGGGCGGVDQVGIVAVGLNGCLVWMIAGRGGGGFA